MFSTTCVSPQLKVLILILYRNSEVECTGSEDFDLIMQINEQVGIAPNVIHFFLPKILIL